ncbi:LTA synthase family protein [Burkholderia vietnamiensis]|uniref:LTA synthase family protein n=1 Tax=Burkholderia vietnamiensis TaxID=60552 RepID=UPI00075EBF56|nr:LTA synthase family protein [Burkholderia vietnamiensis]KVR85193.1 capsular biosynthesis protein [Burkholderia vietnamiensis]MCA8068885.1 LTA synthase family protein [Burkholderia vietnamiensis]UEC05164.1 LTA synthase family protein [Burkholderia vietnamiensis]HDR8988585.1 LTA synthase family protein [Burkholderia vietnamiensis]
MAKPHAKYRRSCAALALHVLAFVLVASLTLLATSRPLFSAFVAVGLVCLMVVVSNAKYRALREPFVFSDLSLFSQLFSHPRLYLPFLSPAAVAGALAAAAALAAGYCAEPSLSPDTRINAALTALVCLFAGWLVAARLPLTLEVNSDQRRHGFFAVFVAFLLNGLRPMTFETLRRTLETSPFAGSVPKVRPDVIVIQSESYFDARDAIPLIEPALYAQFDRACRESVTHGQLAVPAWGANTMRTEFSVLTGIAPERLGYARFYPYAFLRRRCASLAGCFSRAGHRTTAIHPYHAGFFGRDRAYPLLQFERFLDIEHFADAERTGAYVGDAAVADAVIAELDAVADNPVFIFAMTMENHGPLHLEPVRPGESLPLHRLGEDADWRDLTAYLRHVANADAMIGRLLGYLRERRRDTVVCFYGDHVPALGHVFDKLGVSPVKSNYFIWRNFDVLSGERRDLRAEELGSALLRAASVDRTKSQLECSPNE